MDKKEEMALVETGKKKFPNCGDWKEKTFKMARGKTRKREKIYRVSDHPWRLIRDQTTRKVGVPPTFFPWVPPLDNGTVVSHAEPRNRHPRGFSLVSVCFCALW
jgi:hypothetical protein